MESAFVSLALATVGRESSLLVVRTTDGIRFCREGRHEKLPLRHVGAAIENLDRRAMADLRCFVSRLRLANVPMASLDDRKLYALFRTSIMTGDLVVLHRRAGGTLATTSVTVLQRRLVREIEAHHRLVYGGRHYQLVADVDLRGMAGRDSYEVVKHDEAVQILSGLASQGGQAPGTLAKSLAKARDQLTADWRPPLAPDGLILLRRITTQQSYSADLGPALTPSQIKKLLTPSDWIEIEVVFDDGEPYTGPYRIEMPNGSVLHGHFDGNGFFGKYNIDSGKCKLELVDEQEAENTAGATDEMPDPTLEAFSIGVVDELGKPVAGVSMLFRQGEATMLATTNGAGIATCGFQEPDNVTADFESVEALAQALKPIWAECRGIAKTEWVEPQSKKTTVLSLRHGKLEQLPDSNPGALSESVAFDGISLSPEQQQTIVIRPHVTMVRLVGLCFDTGKSFLLPTSLPSLRRIEALYEEHAGEKLVVVGHCDTASEASGSGELGLARAEATIAYLNDDVDAWLAQYETGVPEKKRWGTGEDNQMLSGLVARKQGLDTLDILAYQQWHNQLPAGQRAPSWEYLDEDASLGQTTRAQLIGDYMNLDETTLPPGTTVVAHSCGSAFPLPVESDATSEPVSQQHDRRVEFLFFDETLGILPEPPGDISGEDSEVYPTWRARAEIEDLTTQTSLKEVTFVEMHDGLFRSNSCVLLAEGEAPTEEADGHQSLTGPGLVAGVLAYNALYPGKKLVVAGHCDTMNTVEFNQTLSEERAQVAWACLTGDRDLFSSLCDKRHDGVDLTQIFDWTARVFGFTCQPTVLDQRPSSKTIRHFQESYNERYDDLFASMPDADRFDPPSGSMSEQVWKAIFDCYEVALQQELAKDAAGVAALRDKLVWVDPQRQALGFSEYHPVDNLARDQYRSQANRRVEVLMFDPGEEPDLASDEEHPEVADIYLPGVYVRRHVSMSASGPDFAWVEREAIVQTPDEPSDDAGDPPPFEDGDGGGCGKGDEEDGDEASKVTPDW
jgi:outer membrane protein OmpA-like peptidoglycan-associated protein